MSKKNFTGGLNSLLGDQPDKPKRGRPATQTKEITKSSEEGTKENEIRATFIITKPLLAKVKGMAYWDRLKIKEVVEMALWEAVSKWEAEKGKVTPIPGGERND
jgi:hypothetical protein